jgi:predicted O-linked N-acetylglucosamine transferase (SPINDLY family)
VATHAQHLVTRSLAEYEDRAVVFATDAAAWSVVRDATVAARRADGALWDVKKYANRLVKPAAPSLCPSA